MKKWITGAIFLVGIVIWQSVPLSYEKETKLEMKVKFYRLETKNYKKGNLVGTAEIRDGKLYIDTADPKLKKILSSPYTTIGGEKEGKVFKDKLVTYQPGTKEHLQAIAIECYKFGYIGEIAEEDK